MKQDESGIQSGAVPGLLWDLKERMVMHPDTFELHLIRYEEGRRKPRIEDTLHWFAMAVSFATVVVAIVLSLITSDWGTTATAIWVIVGAAFLFGVATCVFVGIKGLANVYDSRHIEPLTARQFGEGVVEEMRKVSDALSDALVADPGAEEYWETYRTDPSPDQLAAVRKQVDLTDQSTNARSLQSKKWAAPIFQNSLTLAGTTSVDTKSIWPGRTRRLLWLVGIGRTAVQSC